MGARKDNVRLFETDCDVYKIQGNFGFSSHRRALSIFAFAKHFTSTGDTLLVDLAQMRHAALV